MIRTHKAGKGAGDCGRVGLRLKEQKGPSCAPHPWSQRAKYLTWEPSRLPGLKWGWGKLLPLLSCSSGLGFGRSSPTCLSWFTQPQGHRSYLPSTSPLLSSQPQGHWSYLYSTSPLPSGMSYQFTLGFLLSPWGSEFPTSTSRHPSCGETLTLSLPTPPSWLLLYQHFLIGKLMNIL